MTRKLVFLQFLIFLIINQVKLERHEAQLDEKFLFGWEVNEQNGSIEIDATAEGLGYVGIGLSLKGKMDKAEMSIGGVHDESNNVYHGIYIGHHHKVKLDKKRKWTLLEAKQNETHTYVKYSRPLTSSSLIGADNNNIPVHVPIKDKELYVLWAIGKSDKIKKHHGHGKFKINLIHPDKYYLGAFSDIFYNFAIEI